jgi:hypothetical protein
MGTSPIVATKTRKKEKEKERAEGKKPPSSATHD